jgi:hypothetical protein
MAVTDFKAFWLGFNGVLGCGWKKCHEVFSVFFVTDISKSENGLMNPFQRVNVALDRPNTWNIIRHTFASARDPNGGERSSIT